MEQARIIECNAELIEHVWIPMFDGVRLSARVWLPADQQRPAPAILEYLPYRKDDGYAWEDATRHAYFAGQGYASVRVDIRGSGSSEGVLLGEYTRQEHDDAIQVIDWLAGQDWCDGNVGMIGYSWGGFNGLQIAARRPPQLKAVVSAYSTDDRYRRECHYQGGSLLGSNMLQWGATIHACMCEPPDPRVVGAEWKRLWIERLEAMEPYVFDWVRHQRRDGFWEHGSIAEDYAAIEAAVLIVGGWADPYVSAVQPILEGLTCARRGIIGPWAHVLPERGVPGPRIGFLQESVRWFDRWLKGLDTAVERDPLLRVYIQTWDTPGRSTPLRSGEWLGLHGASATDEATLALGDDGVLSSGAAEALGAPLLLAGSLTAGGSAGEWCPSGAGDDEPGDQRDDDASWTLFECEVPPSGIPVLGAPLLDVEIECDLPVANVAARLCEVTADGSSLLVSWGVLNLTHRTSDSEPRELVAGEPTKATLALNACGHRFTPGNVLRMAVASQYWPHVWPAPGMAHVTLRSGSLRLPLLPADARALDRAFGPAEHCEPGATLLKESSRVRTIERHEGDSLVIENSGAWGIHIGLTDTEYVNRVHDRWQVTEDRPLSARYECSRETGIVRDGWNPRVSLEGSLEATATHFVLDVLVEAADDGGVVFERRWHEDVPRDLA